tara:strand:+ start:287 stop:598 length:312 start_codon:yes stop_codon:yes gene_type:complete
MSKSDELSKIREEIDSIDDQILSLINDRAKLAIQAGTAKTDKNKYKPARESSILSRLSVPIMVLSKESKSEIFLMKSYRAAGQQNQLSLYLFWGLKELFLNLH